MSRLRARATGAIASATSRARAERSVCSVGLHGERFQLGHLQQLLHQAAHAGHILAQRRRDSAVAQRVEMGGEDGQRRAQLMGGIGGEVALGTETLVEAIEGGIDRPHQRCQLPRQAVERQAPLAHRRRDPGGRPRETLQGPETVAQGQRADDEPGQQGRQQHRQQLLVQLPAQHGDSQPWAPRTSMPTRIATRPMGLSTSRRPIVSSPLRRKPTDQEDGTARRQLGGGEEGPAVGAVSTA